MGLRSRIAEPVQSGAGRAVSSTRCHAVALSTISYARNISQSSEKIPARLTIIQMWLRKIKQTFVVPSIVAGVVSWSHVPTGPMRFSRKSCATRHPRAGHWMKGPQGTDQAERDVSISLEFREAGRSSSPIPSVRREKLLPSARTRRQHRDPPR